MTAPSLLDELDRVVRLAEKATPGPWRWSENGNILGHMPNGYDEEREVGAIYTERDDDKAPANAKAIISAMHFLRTYHAALADMAKRLEAAERDAVRYRGLRDVLYQENVAVGEAELVLRVYGSCPSIEQFDAAIDAAAQEGEG